MKRELSSQAQVAKEVKQIITGLGIKSRVKSDCFAGGDSVDVHLENQPPKVEEYIKSVTNKYQYGSFNGMIDLYEYTNSRDDIPQTKWLMIENSFDDEIYEKAYQYCKKHYTERESSL